MDPNAINREETAEKEPTEFRIEITIRNNGMIALYEMLGKFLEFALGVLQSAGLEVQGGIFKQNDEEEHA